MWGKVSCPRKQQAGGDRLGVVEPPTFRSEVQRAMVDIKFEIVKGIFFSQQTTVKKPKM